QRDDRDPDREPVDPVRQVRAVCSACDDDEEEQEEAERREGDAPVEDRGVDVGREPQVVHRPADPGGDSGEQQELPAAVQPERPPMAHLEPVVDEPDAAAGERDEEDRQSSLRVFAQDQERDRHREHDQEATHRRRALLQVVVGGQLLLDVLAELVAAQVLDELGPGEDRDRHRDDPRGEDAFHYAGTPFRASATTSRPTDRERLTSTTSPGWTSSGARSAALAAFSPQSPPYAFASSPTPSTTSIPRSPTSAPISSWYSGEVGPSSAISPSTATLRASW